MASLGRKGDMLPKMLVFFIHGVGTRDSDYAAIIIRNIKRHFNDSSQPLCYGSFWGNEFNNKRAQIIDFIKSDVKEAISKHDIDRWLRNDVYRYQERRFQFINDFLGDFLNYQNVDRGREIRKTIIRQFAQFIKNHPQEEEVHFVAHSLGCLILCDLLFSSDVKGDPDVLRFRDYMYHLSLKSITTLGSPLLFIKHFLDIDFSLLNEFIDSQENEDSDRNYPLRWVNVIHSSDLIAYPMKSAIKDEVSERLFFVDQFVWLNANAQEPLLRSIGKQDGAMVVAAIQAHSSYFADNLDGAITGEIIAKNLQNRVVALNSKRITSWDNKSL